jgi:hypothetical protein
VLAPGGGGGRVRVAKDEPVGPGCPGASTLGLRGGGRVRVAKDEPVGQGCPGASTLGLRVGFMILRVKAALLGEFSTR